MYDSFGDGWFGNRYSFVNTLGNIAGSGTLEDAPYGQDILCLEDGCYRILIEGNKYGNLDHISWTLSGLQEPFSATEGDAYSVITGLLSNGDIMPDGCAFPTMKPTLTTAPVSALQEYCYPIELISTLGYGWRDNFLTISAGSFEFSTTLLDGSHRSDSVCLANGCYFFEFGGGNAADLLSYAFVFNDEVTGYIPTSGSIGLLKGKINMGLCTSSPSISLTPTISFPPTANPSVSSPPSLTVAPTRTMAPSTDSCFFGCWQNRCSDLLELYPGSNCVDYESVGCDCTGCRCPTFSPTLSPTVTPKPTNTFSPTHLPSPRPTKSPSMAPTQFPSLSAFSGSGSSNNDELVTYEIVFIVLGCLAVLAITLRTCLQDLRKKTSGNEDEKSAAMVDIYKSDDGGSPKESYKPPQGATTSEQETTSKQQFKDDYDSSEIVEFTYI
jgi:hypothetical protein